MVVRGMCSGSCSSYCSFVVRSSWCSLSLMLRYTVDMDSWNRMSASESPGLELLVVDNCVAVVC